MPIRIAGHAVEPSAGGARYRPLNHGGGRFGSSHGGGFLCVLGDGSVRMVRYTVSLPSFRKLCRRSDGGVLGHDDF